MRLVFRLGGPRSVRRFDPSPTGKSTAMQQLAEFRWVFGLEFTNKFAGIGNFHWSDLSRGPSMDSGVVQGCGTGCEIRSGDGNLVNRRDRNAVTTWDDLLTRAAQPSELDLIGGNSYVPIWCRTADTWRLPRSCRAEATSSHQRARTHPQAFDPLLGIFHRMIGSPGRSRIVKPKPQIDS